MNKARKNYIRSCEVSEITTVELGGYNQKILIEGKKKDLPVVICLHGGPGSPVPFSVGCRGLFPEWTDKAVMVYWDQLGCGINNYVIDDGFHVENFADMTCDLVNYIKARFPENRLYLFGVSWGSILAFYAALRVAEKTDGVFVYGQVLKNLFFNSEVVAAFDGAPDGVKKRVREIVETGTDCAYKVFEKNFKTLYKLLRKYTDAYVNKNAAPAPVGKIVKGLLSSPDYKLRDFMAVVKNGYMKNKTLWYELLKLDLSPLLEKLQVEYRILQGGTDVVTSTTAILKAVEDCNNKNVTVTVVENSGHMPSAAAMDECFKTFSQFVV